MTPEIADLRKRLAAINDHAERVPPAIENTAMAAELQKIKRYLNRSASGAAMSRDRIREAVSDFQRSGELAGAKEARLVCWGTNASAMPGEPVLIEDAKRFPRLLDRVHRLRDDLPPYRRCWRGLLSGYFAYDPSNHAVGAANWGLLRDYLWDNRSVTSGEGFRPDWMITIAEHSNLLTGDPCSRYGKTLFDGDNSIETKLRQDLAIDEHSWFTRELVEAQLGAAIARNDPDFREILPKLLDFISTLKFLQDAGLARALDRYSACATPDINIALRDLAVARWGNPWLDRNDAPWGMVKPAARQMISAWLKLESIRIFFSLLSSDQMNDQRRLRFWERYVDDIEDMYFALGKTAATNPSLDFKKARKDMTGRWTRLASATANNNAFIMTIRNHVFVEFGEKGNALYVFARNKLPFDLKGYSVSDGTERTGLKSHTDHVEKLSHTDHSQTWERRCEQLIYNLTGVLPKSGAKPVQNPRPPSAAASRPTPAASTSSLKSKVTDQEIFDYLKLQKIKYEDFRHKGGSLWVYASPTGGDVPTKLRQWNFAWVDRRKAWFWKQ